MHAADDTAQDTSQRFAGGAPKPGAFRFAITFGAALLLNGASAAIVVVPALGPHGTLQYLLPSPLIWSLKLCLACGAIAGLAAFRPAAYLTGAAAAGAFLTFWFLFSGWIISDPHFPDGQPIGFGRYLLECVSTLQSLTETLLLLLIVPSVAAAGLSGGLLLRLGAGALGRHLHGGDRLA